MNFTLGQLTDSPLSPYILSALRSAHRSQNFDTLAR